MKIRRILSGLLAAALSLTLLAGCGQAASSGTASGSGSAEGPQRYSTVFYDVFDTVTQVIAYCDSEEDFTAQMDALHADLMEYNQLYDIYNDYDGITNVKTINDNAGIAPVTVDDRILGMLELARKMEMEVAENWYTGFYHQLRAEMDEYYRAKRRLRLAKENTEYEEDLYDEAV